MPHAVRLFLLFVVWGLGWAIVGGLSVQPGSVHSLLEGHRLLVGGAVALLSGLCLWTLFAWDYFSAEAPTPTPRLERLDEAGHAERMRLIADALQEVTGGAWGMHGAGGLVDALFQRGLTIQPWARVLHAYRTVGPSPNVGNEPNQPYARPESAGRS